MGGVGGGDEEGVAETAGEEAFVVRENLQTVEVGEVGKQLPST